ncbi:MAG: immunoglobulin-like domain-containing protein [Bacilli bacterium]
MNKKGFTISIVMYILFIMFVVLIMTMFMYMQTRKNILSSINKSVVNNLEEVEYSIPTIKFLNPNTNFLIGDSIDLMQGVMALDYSGNDITSNITITPKTIDTNYARDYNVVYSVTDNKGNTNTVTRIFTVFKANSPVLVEGMTPIKWNESGEVEETTIDDKSWYSYTTTDKKWANAKTKDGSMWVWIPRYAYKITSGFHSSTAGTIEIKFLEDTTNMGYDGSISKTVNQGSNCLSENNVCSRDEFVTHPAFKFGDDELTGIWVAKFEMSNDGSNNPVSLPNVSSWINITMNDVFNVARAMETNSKYGWDTSGNGLDTHLIKDVEWGAAAYLSWSIYGKNNEIRINNSNTFITGCAANNENESAYDGCENKYNTEIGQFASTTGNVYGIYDMSGGSFESTASYVNNGSSVLETNSLSLLNADKKYKDIYKVATIDSIENNHEANSGYYGNAIYETSGTINNKTQNNSWNLDYSRFTSVEYPISYRSGYHSYGELAGIFAFARENGSKKRFGFRITISIKQGL